MLNSRAGWNVALLLSKVRLPGLLGAETANAVAAERACLPWSARSVPPKRLDPTRTGQARPALAWTTKAYEAAPTELRDFLNRTATPSPSAPSKLIDEAITDRPAWTEAFGDAPLHDATAVERWRIAIALAAVPRDTFKAAVDTHGIPTSTLTDNGLVFTTRLLTGRRAEPNALETELARLGALQKNSRPNRPATCGKAGSVTLRHNGKLHHIGIGRIHGGTRVLLIVEGLDIRVLNAVTGELLRALTLNPARDCQPTGRSKPA